MNEKLNAGKRRHKNIKYMTEFQITVRSKHYTALRLNTIIANAQVKYTHLRFPREIYEQKGVLCQVGDTHKIHEKVVKRNSISLCSQVNMQFFQVFTIIIVITCSSLNLQLAFFLSHSRRNNNVAIKVHFTF